MEHQTALRSRKLNMAADEQETATEQRDRLCSEFASELEDGKSPLLDDYVGRLPPGEQANLLAELVRRDHAFRWQVGDPPTVSSYLARFPNHAAAIERACFASVDAGGVPYALVGSLADGGQAIVCLARDNVRGRAVVVKIARKCSESFTQQCRNESQLLARAQHALIVPLLDYFELAGRPFIVLEYVRGKTLAARIKSDGPLAPLAAARTIEQIADAIHYVHESMGCDGRALVYRDLKPAHILLQDGDGKPRLLDFGFASYEESATGSASAAHHGTLEYMSPEQARAFLYGNSRVDRRAGHLGVGCRTVRAVDGTATVWHAAPARLLCLVGGVVQSDRKLPRTADPRESCHGRSDRKCRDSGTPAHDRRAMRREVCRRALSVRGRIGRSSARVARKCRGRPVWIRRLTGRRATGRELGQQRLEKCFVAAPAGQRAAVQRLADLHVAGRGDRPAGFVEAAGSDRPRAIRNSRSAAGLAVRRCRQCLRRQRRAWRRPAGPIASGPSTRDTCGNSGPTRPDRN